MTTPNKQVKIVFAMPGRAMNMSLEMGNLDLIFTWNSDHHFGEPVGCTAQVLSEVRTRGGGRHFDLRTHQMISSNGETGFGGTLNREWNETCE